MKNTYIFFFILIFACNYGQNKHPLYFTDSIAKIKINLIVQNSEQYLVLTDAFDCEDYSIERSDGVVADYDYCEFKKYLF